MGGPLGVDIYGNPIRAMVSIPTPIEKDSQLLEMGFQKSNLALCLHALRWAEDNGYKYFYGIARTSNVNTGEFEYRIRAAKEEVHNKEE